MAASDEFPRFWTASSSPGSGGTVSITIPAATGIIRILDSFTFDLMNNNAAFAVFGIVVSSSDGLFSSYVIGQCGASGNSPGGSGGVSLGIATSPGSSLTITTSPGGVASMIPTLLVQGHDI